MKKICVICGKEFESTGRTTCSNECRQIARKKSIAITRENKKKQNPNTYKVGKYTRNCIICGEVFRTNSKTRDVCYIPHTRKCCICGKEFPVDVYYSVTSTCSSKCASDLRVQKNIEKYGVKSTLQLESTKEKIKQTCMEHYGVENPMQSKEVQEKLKKANQKKYGVDWVVQAEEVKAKSKATNLERYGVEYGIVSDQANEKRKKTNQERYGVDHVFQSKEFKENAKQSNLQRYGTEYYFQSDDFREKAVETWMKNYGVDNPLKSSEIQHRTEVTSMQKYGTRRPQQFKEIRDKIRQTNIENKANKILDETARKEYLEFKKDPKKYLESYINSNPNTTPSSISSNLGLEDNTIVLNLLHKYSLDIVAANVTSMESSIVEFIKSLSDDIDIIVHDRKIIGPKEIDIYLPQYKLGIECNPTVTHNSTISLGQIYGDDLSEPISSIYHQRKSIDCMEKGIFLFHIFGYEWKDRPYVIKSMLRNLLYKNLNRYYARNLVIKEVSGKDADIFLNQNHRQGNTKSKVNLGLYTSTNELVSLMTFGATRMSMGRNKSDDITTWELIRFCNKLNTSVIGGASKLFKYFLKNYLWSKIISFSDIAHTKGNLYELLGFKNVHTSDPGYVWVNLNTDLYLHRMSCQKRNLPKLFNEPNLDIENQTEQQIMSAHGFVQVFDSGTIRWEYTR